MNKEIPKVNNPYPKTKTKITHHSNGEVGSKTSYVNGKKHGVDRRWYESGMKECEIMWKENKRHGMKIDWHESGHLWREQMWIGGKKHGLHRRWNKRGQKLHEIMWRNGKRHGSDRWWYDNGHKWSEEIWRNGQRHGWDTGWWGNGQKKLEIYYLRDIKEYARLEWDDEGNITVANIPTPTPMTKVIIKPRKITSSPQDE